jgi:Hint domain
MTDSSVTNPLTSAGFPPHETGERRRPGRAEYSNPHLIALLRNSTSPATRPADRSAGFEDQDTLALESEGSVQLRETVSPFDGASQVGSPDLIISREQDLARGRCGPDEFLPDHACYVADVRIATANGIALVKDLVGGDIILTPSDDRTVKSTRLFSLNPTCEPLPELAAPVFVRRHALAPGLPGRDLWVSPTRCLRIGDHLVPARLLVNGTTVMQDLAKTSIQYCELLFDRATCPRGVVDPAGVALIQRHLRERAAALGYDWAALPHETGDVLHLLVDGKPVFPTEINNARYAFVVAPGHHVFQLAAQHDAAVLKIEMITQSTYDVISADHPRLLLGWGRCHREADTPWRCIIGPARLPTRPTTGSAMIVVYLKTTERTVSLPQRRAWRTAGSRWSGRGCRRRSTDTSTGL